MRHVSLTLSFLYLLFTIPRSTLGGGNQLDDAKRLFNEGLRRIAEEDYLGALKSFQASYTLKKKAIVLYNMGMCQKALSNHPEAALLLRAYLEEAGDAPSPDMREQARSAYQQLMTLVGSLHVKGAPDNAELTLDQDKVYPLPLKTPLPIHPGQHRLEIVSPGYQRFETFIMAHPGDKVTVHADLVPISAELSVSCDVRPGASVYVDDSLVGACPFVGQVEPGDHAIRVEAADGPPYEKHIAASSGDRIHVAPVFRPPTEVPAPADEHAARKSSADNRLFTQYHVVATASAILSVGFGAMGVVFHIKGARHYDEMQSIEKRWAPSDPNLDDARRYDHIRLEEIPTDLRWMIAGYSTAFVFLCTGAVSFFFGRKQQRSEATNVVISYSPHGIELIF